MPVESAASRSSFWEALLASWTWGSERMLRQHQRQTHVKHHVKERYVLWYIFHVSLVLKFGASRSSRRFSSVPTVKKTHLIIIVAQMAKGGPNQKAVAAAEKKGAAQAVKDAEKARKVEAAIAADWADPSVARSQARAESSQAKADEVARRKREKEALLAAEEAANGSGGKGAKSKIGAASKKGGNKKKDDLSLLADALIGDAEKKAKDKKRLDRIKREREAMAAIEAERKAKEDRAKMDPLLANTDTMIGMTGEMDGYGDGGGPSLAVGRAANVASMADVQASGVDAALSAMSMHGGGGAGDDRHPEKRMKAAYRAYEERMMPEMKSEYPGLKRQQYLDKIYASWKKSPENPLNQQ